MTTNSTRDDTVSHDNMELFASTGTNILIGFVEWFPKQLSIGPSPKACQFSTTICQMLTNIGRPAVLGHEYRADTM